MTEIVVGVDGSPQSTAAVRWAATRAALGSDRLILVDVVPHWANDMPEWGPYASVGRWAREDAGRALSAACAVARELCPTCVIACDRRGGEAWSVLADAAVRASMLVVGSRGQGGYLDQLLGSVASSVAAVAVCPVVIVREHEEVAGSGILLGLDLSSPASAEQDRAALEFATTEARLRGLGLRVVAIDRGWPGSPPQDRGLRDYTDHEASRLNDRMRALTKGWAIRHPGLELSTDIAVGHPVEVLVEESSKADLLVVGRRRRGSRLQLGSVASGVLGHARCSVAVVP